MKEEGVQPMEEEDSILCPTPLPHTPPRQLLTSPPPAWNRNPQATLPQHLLPTHSIPKLHLPQLHLPQHPMPAQGCHAQCQPVLIQADLPALNYYQQQLQQQQLQQQQHLQVSRLSTNDMLPFPHAPLPAPAQLPGQPHQQSLQGQAGSRGSSCRYTSWTGEGHTPRERAILGLEELEEYEEEDEYGQLASGGPPLTGLIMAREAADSEGLSNPFSWKELEKSCRKLDAAHIRIEQIDLTGIEEGDSGDPLESKVLLRFQTESSSTTFTPPQKPKFVTVVAPEHQEPQASGPESCKDGRTSSASSSPACRFSNPSSQQSPGRSQPGSIDLKFSGNCKASASVHAPELELNLSDPLCILTSPVPHGTGQPDAVLPSTAKLQPPVAAVAAEQQDVSHPPVASARAELNQNSHARIVTIIRVVKDKCGLLFTSSKSRRKRKPLSGPSAA